MSVRSMKLGLVMGVGLLMNLTAQAGVNVNNGNFYVAYTDLYMPTAGLNIDITRTYNSRSNYVKGFFGIGWSSEIEGYLGFEKDSVKYFEGGGGNVVHFASSGKNTWANGVFGPQTIRKVEEKSGAKREWVFVLSAATGKSLIFNNKGLLTKIADKNKNFLELVYEGGHLAMMRDNLNNQIRVTWGEFGKQQRISKLESGNFKARYEYNNFGDLVRATGADGISYAYNYDDEHNMTKIAYGDGSYKEMEYNKAKDWITKFRDKDRMVTSYVYNSDSLDPENKFGTTVARSMEGAKDRDVSKYWYEFRKRADGSKYNYKAVTWIRGIATETIFTECCGTPLAITQWNLEPAKAIADTTNKWTIAEKEKKSTFFEYYADGLLKKKTAPDGAITALTYEDKYRKVSSVERNGRKVEYNYDARGNLAWAFDSAENRRLDLKYDVGGRLTAVTEKRVVGNKPTKRDILFSYNPSNGKPETIKEISQDGSAGLIKIKYDSNGDVAGIMNGQGRAVSSEREFISAQHVADTFQNLIEIVQPAGVTLTPEG